MFLGERDSYEMTPLYDVVSMWPYYGNGPNQFQRKHAGPAMILRGKNTHKYFNTIKAQHWHGLALRYDGGLVWPAMVALLQQVPGALAQVHKTLPPDFPERTWQRIAEGMQGEADRFLSEIEDEKL